ncbi:alpha/beta fold hydrolase [Radiobacillus deserti]|uniref:Alpha/beta hydrolase n=1 Tax=Radiobacillus deserti TaxID=2594883 RepID=A0A516KCT4_9BACI|nr:alpha/beta hydrolase [Radiobacillus deserti]QDP39180.1 alpha/beta hydrolase [Radiobacillus deserti]
MKYQAGNNILHYFVEGSGHPVFVLHGIGTDHRAMKGWLEPIFVEREGFQRIYVDLPWHGESVCKGITSTVEARNILSTFLTDLIGERSYSIIGHSYGGYVAQGLISDHLTGLCLITPAIHKKERDVPSKTAYNRDESALAEVDSDIRTAFETLMVDQSADNLQLFLSEVQPGRSLADRKFLTSNWREFGYFFESDPLAKRYDGRALIIAGKLDAICGYKDYYKIIENMPNSTFAVLPSGHLPQIEKRQTVQHLVNDWLEQSY